MAPELFVAGRPVDASIDIYAFGMLMWELITGRTPYSDTEYGSRALMKAVYHGKRPAFPENTLPAYKWVGKESPGCSVGGLQGKDRLSVVRMDVPPFTPQL